MKMAKQADDTCPTTGKVAYVNRDEAQREENQMIQPQQNQHVWAYVRRKWRPAIVLKSTTGRPGVDWHQSNGTVEKFPAKQPRVTVRLMRGQVEYTVPNTRRFVQSERPMRQTSLELRGGLDDE